MRVVTWTLEMLDPAALRPSGPPRLDAVDVRRAGIPPPGPQRFLYTPGGGPGGWVPPPPLGPPRGGGGGPPAPGGGGGGPPPPPPAGGVSLRGAPLPGAA